MSAETISRDAAADKRRTKVFHMAAAIRAGYEVLDHPNPTRAEVADAMARVDQSGRVMWVALAQDCPYCSGHGDPSPLTRRMVLDRFPDEEG